MSESIASLARLDYVYVGQ